MKRKQKYTYKNDDADAPSEDKYYVPISSPEIEKAIEKLSRTHTGEELQKIIYMTYTFAKLAYEISKKSIYDNEKK